MKKYTSNTYFLIDKLFYLIFLIGLISYVVYLLDDSEIILYGGIVVISVLLLIFTGLLTRLASIDFTDKGIIVKYKIPWKIKQIDYSTIMELQYIHRYGMTSLNIIKYKSNNLSIRKLKLTSIVSYDDYFEFVKWMKNKNNMIEFKIFPSDCKLKQEFDKEFK